MDEMGGHLKVFTKPLVLVLVAVFAGLSFQNCSNDAPFGVRDRLMRLTESSVADDFPYEASFDQIAYMSCSEQEDVSNDFQTFFTFRLGAYRNAGLRLTERFFENTERMDSLDRINVLMQHQLSQGSRLQFALRTRENFQLAFINDDSATDGANGIDYSNVFTTIGEQSFSSYVVSQPEGKWMNYYAGALFEREYRFEGSVYFNSSENLQNEMRSFLYNRGFLALTFSDEGTINPRGPGSPLGSNEFADTRDLAKNVFGMGAAVRFKQPQPIDYGQGNGNAYQNMPPRILASAEDVFIDPRSQRGSEKAWSCSSQMAFMIVLPQHATYTDSNNNTVTRCRMDPDPANPSQLLRDVRNSLYAEDWYVDLDNRCVVPKPDRVGAGSCYGKGTNNFNTVEINYDFSQPCGFSEGNSCPHFVSICQRNP